MKGIAVIMILMSLASIGLAPLGTAQDARDCTYYGPYADCGRPSGFVAMKVPSFVDGTYNPWPYYASVPVACEVRAAEQRLWANMYLNQNFAWWQAQAARERLLIRTSACPGCYGDVQDSASRAEALQWDRFSRGVEAGGAENTGCRDCDNT